MLFRGSHERPFTLTVAARRKDEASLREGAQTERTGFLLCAISHPSLRSSRIDARGLAGLQSFPIFTSIGPDYQAASSTKSRPQRTDWPGPSEHLLQAMSTAGALATVNPCLAQQPRQTEPTRLGQHWRSGLPNVFTATAEILARPASASISIIANVLYRP